MHNPILHDAIWSTCIFVLACMLTKIYSSSIAIGFSGKDVPLNRPPGWEPESWAYHGDDGHTFACQSSGRHYGPEFATGDIIGCGVNFTTGHAFFTRNGESLGKSASVLDLFTVFSMVYYILHILFKKLFHTNSHACRLFTEIQVRMIPT